MTKRREHMTIKHHKPESETQFMEKFAASKPFVAFLTVLMIGGVDGVKEKVWPHENTEHRDKAIEARLDTLDKKIDRLTERFDNYVDGRPGRRPRAALNDTNGTAFAH